MLNQEFVPFISKKSLNKSIFQIIHSPDIAKDFSIKLQQVQNSKHTTNFEIDYESNHYKIQILAKKHNLNNKNVYATITNINDQQYFKSNYEKSLNNYKLLEDNLIDTVFHLDLLGRIEFVSNTIK